VKKILILGWGISGKGALQWLYDKGYRCFFVIDKSAIDLQELKKQYPEAAFECDLDRSEAPWKEEEVEFVALAPGVGPKSPNYIRSKKADLPFMGEMQMGLSDLEGYKIGITGSNGKSTTVTMLAHILSTLGFEAQAVGNIGVAVSCLPRKGKDRYWVIEASSYHLETLEGKFFDIAAVLNISENHLDRYLEMEKYVQAKACIQKALKPQACLFLKRDIVEQWPSFWHHPHLEFWDQMTLSLDFEKLISDKVFAGKEGSGYKDDLGNDVENIKVVLAICEKLGIDLQRAWKALKSYSKLSHRMEVVGTLGEVKFINDSKATSLAATLHALKALKGPLVLIAGGVHKGADYYGWREPLADKAVGVCLFGQAKEKIAMDLQFDAAMCTIHNNLEQAVERAHNLLKKRGGTVLFSPGCASFDMFKNFEERGDRFKQCFHELKVRGEP
jgi:UDP-N-acetylmuramoylalanine--D-glutamate ligase